MPRSKATPSDFTSYADVLEAELADWIEERAALEVRISSRRSLLEALRRETELAQKTAKKRPITGHITPADEPRAASVGPPLKTSEAILRVLDESPHVALSAQAIFSTLERRGWAPVAENPMNAVRSALWNLAKHGKIQKIGDNQMERLWASLSTKFAPMNGSANGAPSSSAEGSGG